MARDNTRNDPPGGLYGPGRELAPQHLFGHRLVVAEIHRRSQIVAPEPHAAGQGMLRVPPRAHARGLGTLGRA